MNCACCPNETVNFLEFLAIDHVAGGGNQHRKALGGGDKVYRWLVSNGYPEGFQVLCHNCNCAKGFYGECPHEAERREKAA
jgi:hypothetical protein